MTYEEYQQELNKALEEVDWMHPRDKNGPAYKVIARAAADRTLPTEQWGELNKEYYERTAQA